MKNRLSKLVDLLFPTHCLGCKNEGDILCKLCKKSVQAHSESCLGCHRLSAHYHFCERCISQYRPLGGILIAFTYSGVIKKLILHLKYYHHYTLAAYLAEKLALLVQTHPQLHQATLDKKIVVTYVPSHRRRKYMTKGYNQSELLAKELAKHLDVPLFSQLTKNQFTTSQTRLSRQARQTNLDGVFSLKKHVHIPDETVFLIVDDITTTGSTIKELAKTIEKHYPKATYRGVVIGRHGK